MAEGPAWQLLSAAERLGDSRGIPAVEVGSDHATVCIDLNLRAAVPGQPRRDAAGYCRHRRRSQNLDDESYATILRVRLIALLFDFYVLVCIANRGCQTSSVTVRFSR